MKHTSQVPESPFNEPAQIIVALLNGLTQPFIDVFQKLEDVFTIFLREHAADGRFIQRRGAAGYRLQDIHDHISAGHPLQLTLTGYIRSAPNPSAQNSRAAATSA